MEVAQTTLREIPPSLISVQADEKIVPEAKKYQLICVGISKLIAVTAYITRKVLPKEEQKLETPELLNKHPSVCWELNNDKVQVLTYSYKVYARPGNYALICKAFDKARSPVDILEISHCPAATIEVLGAADLKIAAKSILPYFSKFPAVVLEKKIRLSALILPFYVIPDFSTHMLAYFEDPDDGIKVASKGDEIALNFADLAEAYGCKSEAMQIWGKEMDPQAVVDVKEAKRTRADQMAFGYMLAFCMVKSGGDYVANALRKRLETYSNILRDSGFNVENFLSSYYNSDALSEATRIINFFPRLKSTIYSTIVTTQSESCLHFRTILEGVQMTKFNFIYAFLFQPSTITALHFNRDVTRYFPKFIEVYRSLVKKYGDLWQYHKLICPGESLTNLSQFGKLVHAGLAFAATRPGNAGRIKNVQGYKEVPGSFFAMVTEEIGTADDARVANYQEVYDMLKEINSEFKLNEGVTEVVINEKIAASSDPTRVANVRTLLDI